MTPAIHLWYCRDCGAPSHWNSYRFNLGWSAPCFAGHSGKCSEMAVDEAAKVSETLSPENRREISAEQAVTR